MGAQHTRPPSCGLSAAVLSEDEISYVKGKGQGVGGYGKINGGHGEATVFGGFVLL